MIITDGGTLVRTRTNEISILGRNTQGVRVIRPGKDEKVIGLDRIASLGDEVDEDALIEGEEMPESVDGTSSEDEIEN